MKFYIAGITLSAMIKNSHPQVICETLVKLFPKIIADAQAAYGPNVITVIALPEHALTSQSISISLKRQLLNLLMNGLPANVMLIPGSFTANGNLAAHPKKKDKIDLNYKIMDEGFYNDCFFEAEQTQAHRIKNYPTSAITFMENSAYILTNKYKIKHKKNVASLERTKLDPTILFSSIFYIGMDNSLKLVELDNYKFYANIVICREHFFNPEICMVTDHFPLLEIIVSNSIGESDFDIKKLLGALNAHMDSVSGLKVYCNDLHPERNLITHITACEYSKHLNDADDKKVFTPVKYFKNDVVNVQPQPSKKISNQ